MFFSCLLHSMEACRLVRVVGFSVRDVLLSEYSFRGSDLLSLSAATGRCIRALGGYIGIHFQTPFDGHSSGACLGTAIIRHHGVLDGSLFSERQEKNVCTEHHKGKNRLHPTK
jgi:hypothetical protein